MNVLAEKAKTVIFEEFAAQKPQVILLVPVFMAFGISTYFSLDFEPNWVLSLCALVMLLIAVFSQRHWKRFLLLPFIFFALGFAAANMRTAVIDAPMIDGEIKFISVEGQIEAIQPLTKGARVILSSLSLENLEENETPRYLRLKLWDYEGFQVGQRINGLASVRAPSPPVIPGGFDFQRMMFFQGIGGVGFFYKKPEVIEDARDFRFMEAVETLRHIVSLRLDDALGAREGALARALMIGQRQSIEVDDMEAIRASGLAHMLAISGLHVGLFSGVIFFSVRFLMSLFPSFTLRHPIKKYAAAIAIVAALFYMLIAGATIPTQRAMISVAVVFMAIILYRSPISLRVVAFAAVCVLLIFPESLLSASFQMSFAAVVCLVAFYDWKRPVWSDWARQASVLRKIVLYFAGVSLTSIVAMLATGALTLYHFQAWPLYGLLANLVAVPLLAFVIMPFVILAFIAIPFGLEGLPLKLVEPVLSVFYTLSHGVSDMPGAVFHVPMFSNVVLVFFVLGVLSIIIFRRRLRVLLVSVFLLCTIMNFKLIQYDMFISSDFDLVGFRSNETEMVVSNRRKNRYMREQWQEAYGLVEFEPLVFPKSGVLTGEDYALSCDEIACRFEKDGVRLSYLKQFDVGAFKDECGWAKIVISQDAYDQMCDAEIVLNRRNDKRYGVHAVTFLPELKLTRVDDFRAKRPWVQR